MSDAGIWNTILGNDGGGDGPSATQMTGILGNVGSPDASPPDTTSSVNLTPWNPGGFGSIAPLPLPQIQDTSAALLPSSSFAPSQPLYDPTPFAPPQLTMDQLAMMYGMAPDQIAALRNGAEQQAWGSFIAKGALGIPSNVVLPEAGVPELAAEAIDSGMLFHDLFDLKQQLQTAPDQAVFKSLNDSELRRIPSAARARIP